MQGVVTASYAEGDGHTAFDGYSQGFDPSSLFVVLEYLDCASCICIFSCCCRVNLHIFDSTEVQAHIGESVVKFRSAQLGGGSPGISLRGVFFSVC